MRTLIIAMLLALPSSAFAQGQYLNTRTDSALDWVQENLDCDQVVGNDAKATCVSGKYTFVLYVEDGELYQIIVMFPESKYYLAVMDLLKECGSPEVDHMKGQEFYHCPNYTVVCSEKDFACGWGGGVDEAYEGDACKDLQARVCDLCGKRSNACKFMKNISDDQNGCIEALKSLDEFEETLNQYEPDARKVGLDTLCNGLGE